MTTLLIIGVILLAYSNGANDNFKGVASLYGSKTCSYKTALVWATCTTFAGSVAAMFWAEALLKKFSGKGLVPDALTQSPSFVLAVVLGAGLTVLLATKLGFPISTTHAITGALVGAGTATNAASVSYAALWKNFFMPLMVSPFLAFAVGAVLVWCVRKIGFQPVLSDGHLACHHEEESTGKMPVGHDSQDGCLTIEKTGETPVLLFLHFISAGAVSFARGLNDTPKIAALLLLSGISQKWMILGIVAIAMAIGGIINAKKVAATMSEKLTDMTGGEGFIANLTTALLVNTASMHGLPVSTTHVSVGSLLGMGCVTKKAKWQTVRPVLASWLITLPVAFVIAAIVKYIF